VIQEIRTYRIVPGSLAEVEKRFGEAYEKRKKYSELTAFWHTEIGPLNEIIHVWGYRDLAERDRERVRPLAAILRVADALDHDHRQQVTAVSAKARGSELRLKVKTRGDVTLDEWSVGNKGDLFQEEFGLKPVVNIRG